MKRIDVTCGYREEYRKDYVKSTYEAMEEIEKRLELLFNKWKRRNVGDFYMFSFCSYGCRRYQINERGSDASFYRVRIVDGVEISASYSLSELYSILSRNKVVKV